MAPNKVRHIRAGAPQDVNARQDSAAVRGLSDWDDIDAMRSTVQRQNRQHATVHPEPPDWKIGAMLLVALVCLLTAYLLYAAGALS